MKLKNLLQALEDYEIQGPEDGEALSVCFNSKEAKPGSVFVAIPGFKADGRKFAAEAAQKGAIAVVFEGEFFDNIQCTQIRVSGARLALARLAAQYFVHPTKSFYLCGVTGTNGKTTLTYLLEALWRGAGKETGIVGTVTTRYRDQIIPSSQTTPESRDLQSLFSKMAKAGVERAAIEVSSHAVAQNRVEGCEFDSAIFTNLTQDHLDFHPTMEDYYRAKEALFTHHLKKSGKADKLAVVGREDEFGSRLIGDARLAGIKAISYGMDSSNDIYPEEHAVTLNGIRARVLTPQGELNISSPLFGQFNLLNLMAACGIALHSGLSAKEIENSVAKGVTVPGRMERVNDPEGRLIFVDYAHTPDALNNVLKAIRALQPKKVVTVFGCGGDRDKTKRPLMGYEAARLSDEVIATSDNPRTEDPNQILNDILPGIKRTNTRHRIEIDRKRAIEMALQETKKGEVVLIAGKGHEDYQIIGNDKHPFSDPQTVRDILGIRS